MDSDSIIKAHFKLHDPIIYQVMAPMDLSSWRQPKTLQLEQFQTLTRQIIAQQLHTKVAALIATRFVELLGGPGFTPESVLATQDELFRSVGLSRTKIAYIKDLAHKTQLGLINYSMFATADEEQVIAELTQVKGIGPWTAEMFLLFGLGREDVFSHGDWGLKKALKLLYQLPAMPTYEEAERIIASWRPYRSYGCLALWHSLEI